MKAFRLFCIAVISAIIIQLTTPHIALADDAAPPPPSDGEFQPAEPSQPAEDQPVDTTQSVEAQPAEPSQPAEDQPADITEPFEMQPAESSQPSEIIPAETERLVDAPPTETTQTAEILPAETEQPIDTIAIEETPTGDTENILDALPENTDLVILDANNQPVPLATESASSAIANSDPAWCPDGASLAAGTCTNYATFSSLITGLHSLGSLTNGTVYVQEGYYAGPETSIIFDGTYLPNVGNLSLFGGWDLTLPIPTQTGSTTLGAPLSFINWTHDLTIQDINIDHANGTGLTIQTTNPVALTNVNATYNKGDGITIRTNANITLDNVHANNNTGDGLVVTASKQFYDCSFSGVFYPDATFHSPEWGDFPVTPGLHILRRCFRGQGITLQNSGFDNNSGNGMTITTGGSITLLGVTTTGNDNDGASINFFYNIIPAFPWSYYRTLPYSKLVNYLAPNMDAGWLSYYQSQVPPEPYAYDLYAKDFIDKIVSAQINTNLSGNGGVDLDIQQETNPYWGPEWGIENTVFQWCEDVCALPPVEVPILGGEQINTGGNGENPSNSNSGGGSPVITGGGESGAGKKGDISLCAQNSITILQLPSGNNLTVYCPVSGTLSVKEQTRKGLPAPLPDGMNFVSGLEITLSQDNAPTRVITDSGHLKPSFVVPADQAGKNLVILFWDTSANKWVELPAFGAEGSTSLSNGGTISEGVQLLDNIGQIEAGVNFPGIFVLAVK